MIPEILTESRRAALNKVCTDNQVTYLGMFGSHARGDHKASSDVDLLVDFSGKKSFFDLARLQSELEEILGKKVDLVPRRSLKSTLKPYVNKDLIPITFS